jgi:uncharacterized cupin superfamily protein
MEHLIHIDDIEPREYDAGDIAAARKRLGPALGTKRVGVSHYRLPPGRRMMPVHVHADEEEIFYVLSGGGLSWQKGTTCRVAQGDCLVHVCNGDPHTLVAGEDGLEVLVFATGSDTNITFLPRAGAWFVGPRWMPADGPHPFQLEVEAGPLELDEPGERPPNVVNIADVETDRWGEGDVDAEGEDLSLAAGSERSGLNVTRVPAGKLDNPPHCHSVEEEVFVVLEGSGELELWDLEQVVERAPVGPGHVVARPPRTGVSHAFRGGPDGLTLLVYGTRDDADVAFYPRSQKVNLRGIGVIFRPERLDYWDGE